MPYEPTRGVYRFIDEELDVPHQTSGHRPKQQLPRRDIAAADRQAMIEARARQRNFQWTTGMTPDALPKVRQRPTRQGDDELYADDDLSTRPPRSARRYQPEEIYNDGDNSVYTGEMSIPKRRSAQQQQLPPARQHKRNAGNFDEQDVIDSTTVSDLDTASLVQAQQPTRTAGSGIVPFGLFLTILCLFCIAAQIYQIVNPFTVTVTLQARSQHISLTGTVQLGRLLNPITISQSTTIQATGHGHQDARSATGFITFYNGSNIAQTMSAGTTLTGQDGVQVEIDQTVTVPAANLPQIGEATASAHAINAGTAGNIPAYDISIALSSYLTAKNTAPFQGGQDARDYQFVTKGDITTAADPLKATVAQSISGAIQGQVQANESFATPSCATTTTSDHQVGQEASQVKVTVGETCSALAYNDQVLTSSVTQLLITQAMKKLGSGYGLLDTPQITITGATPGKHVTLSFSAMSTWVFGISSQQQRTLKTIIAGKNTQSALQVLRSLPGIESATLASSGFGDASRIPKHLSSIHLMIYVA